MDVGHVSVAAGASRDGVERCAHHRHDGWPLVRPRIVAGQTLYVHVSSG